MKSSFTLRKHLGALVLGLGLACLPLAAQAQNNGGNRPNFQNMTPEQRAQFIQQAREAGWRRQLEQDGVTDKAAQDPIVAYLNTQETARLPLRDQARKVQDALTNKAADAQLFALFNDLRTQIAAEKARVQTAQAALDGQIGYTKNPRLGIILTMMGVIGDESTYINAGGFGGRGFGGGGAGGRGGGGAGGGNNN